MKKLKKLSLKKEVIAKLERDEMNSIKGGVSEIPGNCPSLDCLTKGACDVPTIGHDDGPNCLSASDWGWCWCYGV